MNIVKYWRLVKEKWIEFKENPRYYEAILTREANHTELSVLAEAHWGRSCITVSTGYLCLSFRIHSPLLSALLCAMRGWSLWITIVEFIALWLFIGFNLGHQWKKESRVWKCIPPIPACRQNHNCLVRRQSFS